MMPSSTERLNLSITTSSGDLQAQIDVPTGFIPITKIVPVIRSLGDQAQELEIANTLQAGKTISCQKGCAACCRPMIPVSPPEAFALVEAITELPEDHQSRIKQNLATTKARLQAAGLLKTLQDLADSPHQHSDDELESLNRAYYALRLPCIFLENEVCSIYDHRPAGCRSHLVTSPPELCKDMANNPIEELPIPLRAGTVLSLLWADLTKSPVRLVPLPMAIEWAETHQDLNTQTWKGFELMNKAMDGLGKFLNQTLTVLAQKKPVE
jgi:Fe-S-cluster containining protein